MKKQPVTEDPWDYASYDGVERLQLQQTAKMSLTERLRALDRMISLAKQLQPDAYALRESEVPYGEKAE